MPIPFSAAVSPHASEYRRLIQAGWSSTTLQRYSAFRYGERISDRAFRRWRTHLGIEPPPRLPGKAPDGLIDVVEMRSELVQVQVGRITIDYGHERSMGKLLPTTRREIALLDGLLNSLKADLHDLGLLPKAGLPWPETTVPGRVQTSASCWER